MQPLLPAFSLRDQHGVDRSFPTGRVALLAIVKDDCPTCQLVMPLLEMFQRSYGAGLDVFVIGQTTEGNAALVARHGVSAPLLDDSSLKVSFAYDTDTVPALYLADGVGHELSRLHGFVRDEWRLLDAELAQHAGATAAPIDWHALPEWRPGCGSLSVDPRFADRLAAEAENSPLRARRIEIAPADDVFEFMFDQGFSDGLPVIPPTPERVLRMLSGTRRDPQSVVAVVPPNLADATVEKVAINAVMAGCRPEYLPVVIAALEAVCTDEFNVHGVMATTMGASPVLVINGPIRQRIGLNMKIGALGQGTRANASIGRALRLIIRNVGGARPGGTERSTLGNPMKFTMCFAEWEERSDWTPLHVERGFAAQDSVVTAFAMTSGPSLIVDQTSRSAAQIAGSIALCMESIHHPRAHMLHDALLVVCPEHVDTLATGGYSKADLRRRIQEVTARPLAELVADDISGVGMPAEKARALPAEALARRLPKFASDDMIHIVVAGSDAGKFSGMFHGWVGGEIGSVPVSRKIDDR
jgi:thiol-disulfide isomerase/thioredoxin